jgi:hypothetical protein
VCSLDTMSANTLRAPPFVCCHRSEERRLATMQQTPSVARGQWLGVAYPERRSNEWFCAGGTTAAKWQSPISAFIDRQLGGSVS